MKICFVNVKEIVHMISTIIDQSLGLEFPIFQGGMAWVADASLAAGVSNAGGLGLIAAMNSNGEQLRDPLCRLGSRGCGRGEYPRSHHRRGQSR